MEEVLALAAEQQIDPARGHNDVIPSVPAQHVIAERILDDVVAVAAEHIVGLHAGI